MCIRDREHPIANGAMNVLEAALTRGQEGSLSMQTLLWVFASSTVFVPSGSDPGDKMEAFRPVLFERKQTPMMACYSALERAGNVRHLAPFMVTMTGWTVLAGMQPGQGIVVNPGSSIGFDIAPQGIATLLREIGG